MASEIKVLIADDHAVVRDGLRRILEGAEGLRVVGEARDGREAVTRALQLRPDVVIMDINMTDMNGLAATREIRAADENVRVLGLTVHESPDYFFSMLEAGAAGYLLKKDATSAELVTAIRSVYEDNVYLHPTVSRWLVHDRLSRGPAGLKRKLTGELTAREEEVLTLVAKGYTNQQISEAIYVSPSTVQTHRANIMQKLGLHSRSDLVKYAISRGIIHLTE